MEEKKGEQSLTPTEVTADIWLLVGEEQSCFLDGVLPVVLSLFQDRSQTNAQVLLASKLDWVVLGRVKETEGETWSWVG